MSNAIALDIGGSFIKYGLINNLGEIIYKSSIPTKQDNILDAITFCVKDSIRFALSRSLTISGIGIGVPSIVEDGEILYANNITNLNNQNLRSLLDNFNLPVYIENDANLLGLCEITYGSAKNFSEVVFLTIGTGVGGALLINKNLYRGYRNRGAELGHIIINYQGKRCTCGSDGCLEAYASVSALISDYKDLLLKNNLIIPSNLSGKFIVEQYLKNNNLALKVMTDHFNYLSAGIISIINIFSPQKVIIGGGLSESGDFYINNIKRIVKEKIMVETSTFTTIERSAFGNIAGCLGAAALVFNSGKV